jgi:hypothetical protein
MSKDVKWFGTPGHFICAFDCRFHMCTQVGNYLVSTVGELFFDSTIREITAQSRGITLEGRGDSRRADYMTKIGFEDIGYKRKYETLVFKAGASCVAKECNCGLPEIDGSELDSDTYNDRKSATEGHRAMVSKYMELDNE